MTVNCSMTRPCKSDDGIISQFGQRTKTHTRFATLKTMLENGVTNVVPKKIKQKNATACIIAL